MMKLIHLPKKIYISDYINLFNGDLFYESPKANALIFSF